VQCVLGEATTTTILDTRQEQEIKSEGGYLVNKDTDGGAPPRSRGPACRHASSRARYRRVSPRFTRLSHPSLWRLDKWVYDSDSQGPLNGRSN
jgi:hypothetical protein